MTPTACHATGAHRVSRRSAAQVLESSRAAASEPPREHAPATCCATRAQNRRRSFQSLVALPRGAQLGQAAVNTRLDRSGARSGPFRDLFNFQVQEIPKGEDYALIKVE